jgi:hypothetical protein
MMKNLNYTNGREKPLKIPAQKNFGSTLMVLKLKTKYLHS